MTPKPSTTIRSVSITAMLVLSVFAGVAVGNAIAVQESGETDANVSIDTNGQGVVEVTNSSNATISGTSSLEPGSKISLRIRSDASSNRFIYSASAIVDANGNWEATFDLASIDVGTEFTVRVRKPVNVEHTGKVVETKSDGSESGVPGFGLLTALIALAAAALVARRNV